MIRVPRLALATPATGPEPAPAVLGLLAGLNSRHWRVQHFSSRARPTNLGLAGRASGLPGRHLDAWLMDEAVLGDLFRKGSRHADLAVVEGTLDDDPSPADLRRPDRPGRLAPIAQALDLPRVAVVRVEPCGDFHLPRLPRSVDAILLDELADVASYPWMRRAVEVLTRKPVIGAVERLPEARAALASPDRWQATSALAALGTSFLKFADPDALRALAESRPMDAPADPPAHPRQARRFRVAYAFDPAFGGYFPDTLETLEALGAELVEFSPLRDEGLPEGADLVLIGCGMPDLYPEDLSANYSMIAALRSHVCRGGRLYAEGGGMVYLGRSLTIGGRTFPMAGVLPIETDLRARQPEPTPVSRTLMRSSWLGPRGTTVRGYRSGRWTLRPAGEIDDCPARSGTLTGNRDLFFRNNAIGSLIHLHLASLPQVVEAFAAPSRSVVRSV